MHGGTRVTLLVMSLTLAGCSAQDNLAPSSANEVARFAKGGKGGGGGGGGGGGSCPKVPGGTTSISVLPATVSLERGETLQLTVTNQEGKAVSACAVQWSSADLTVVSVSGGTVSAVAKGGPVRVTATLGGKRPLSNYSSVTVRPKLSDLRIVFAETQINNPIDGKLYTINGDGTSRTYLNQGIDPVIRGDVLLSRGVFNDNYVYRMSASGANRVQLVAGYLPDLAPDARRFTHTNTFVCSGGGYKIRVADISGSPSQELEFCTDSHARWSPSGDRLLYARAGVLYSLLPDGTSRQTLLDGYSALTAEWAPDGASIVFSGKFSGASLYSLYTVPAAGGTPTLLYPATTSNVYVTDWSSDGFILFVTGSLGRNELWAVREDGSAAKLISSCANCLLEGRWVR